MILSQGTLSAVFRLWTTASAAKKEGFSWSHHDGWWKMDSLQQPKEKKFMGTVRSCFYIVGSAEYSRCEGYAVYLVGPGRCYLLWAVETEQNHHWGTVSNAIDAFEPSTARKAATIRAEARKSDSAAWQTLGITLSNPLKPTWIRSRNEHFYRNSIQALPERWAILWMIHF